MNVPTISIDGHVFEFVEEVLPEVGADGRVMQFMPQSRYKGHGKQRLNPQGAGPFCRFRAAKGIASAGVYVVTVNDETSYVGESVNLSVRWGLGQYGSIQPKNCYVGGQSTNCKVNSRVLSNALAGKKIKLWFYPTHDHKAVELKLRSTVNPPWNG